MIKIEWTPQEAIFLSFAQQTIKGFLTQSKPFLHLSFGPFFQEDFYSWTRKNCKDQKFTEEQLNLRGIIASVWAKSIAAVDEQLARPIAVIENEKRERLLAEDMRFQYDSIGCAGRFFTRSQVHCLLDQPNKIISKITS